MRKEPATDESTESTESQHHPAVASEKTASVASLLSYVPQASASMLAEGSRSLWTRCQEEQWFLYLAGMAAGMGVAIFIIAVIGFVLAKVFQINVLAFRKPLMDSALGVRRSIRGSIQKRL